MLIAEKIRRERGLTYAAIAAKAHMSDMMVSRVLRGVVPPYPKYREAIASALEWRGNPSELFEEVEETGND